MGTAYSAIYLDDAMNNLGEAVEYAVLKCRLTADAFMDRFCVNGMALRFSVGEPAVVSGMSGTEMAQRVLRETGYDAVFHPPVESLSFSREYWSGWILAYYQWRSERSFRSIVKRLPMKRITELYPTLHEAAEEKFVVVADQYFENDDTSALQRQRRLMAYSQSMLAKKANVNLRTLQQYETGAKDLRKASCETVLSLARTLGCTVEDLLV